MQLTRREILALGGGARATALLGGPARAQKKGGDVIVGTISAPPPTDAQASTAEVSRKISPHWIETLWRATRTATRCPTWPPRPKPRPAAACTPSRCGRAQRPGDDRSGRQGPPSTGR